MNQLQLKYRGYMGVLPLLVAGFIISGCSDIVTRVKTPTSTAKFPIEQFKQVDEYEVKNVRVIDSNGTKFVTLPMNDFMGLLEQYKKIKNDYSILRNNLIKFEKDNDELNR